LNIFATCLQIFFAHPWNNFLHATVEQMIQVLLDCENESLKLSLLTESKLIELICEASQLNEEESSKPRGVRRGYMGHITTISLNLINAAANTPSIEKLLNEHEEWNNYKKGALQSTRERESKTLLYAPTEEYTNEEPEELEGEYDSGLQYETNEYGSRDDYNTVEQDFKLEDDDEDEEEEDEEGVMIQSRIEEVTEVWEEREIQDTEMDNEAVENLQNQVQDKVQSIEQTQVQSQQEEQKEKVKEQEVEVKQQQQEESLQNHVNSDTSKVDVIV